MDIKVKNSWKVMSCTIGSWPLALLPLRALKLLIHKQLLETHTFIKRWKQSSIPTGPTVVKVFNKLSPDSSRVVRIYFHFPCTNRQKCWLETELTYLMVQKRLMYCGDQLNVFFSWKTLGFPVFSRLVTKDACLQHFGPVYCMCVCWQGLQALACS